MMGASAFVSGLSNGLVVMIAVALGFLFLLLLLRILLRKDWAAVAAVAFVGVGLAAITGPWINVPFALANVALLLFVLLRIGLVATLMLACVQRLFSDYPITLQSSAWYSGIGFAALLVIAAIALYGFRVSLGGRRLLDFAGVED